MSTDRLMKMVLEEGHWVKCLFCYRALPKEEWRAKCLLKLPTQLMKDTDYITDSGMCSFCAQIQGVEDSRVSLIVGSD